ncbi:unnamed protein product, partial [Closterium sp. Naga37s-1]
MRLCKKQGIPFLPFKPLIGQALDLYRRTPHSSPPSPNQTPSPASSASASPSSASPSPESPPSTHGPAVLLPRLHLWREQYGDVFGFTVGATVQLVVTDPALVRQVLVSRSGRVTKTARARKIMRLLGNGLPLSEGSLWARQRRIVTPAFRPAAIRLQQQSQQTGQGMLSTERAKEGGGEGAPERAYTERAYKERLGRACMEVDVQESMSLVALDVIGLAAFGSAVTHEGGEKERRRKERGEGEEKGLGKEGGSNSSGSGGRGTRPVQVYKALSKLAELDSKRVTSWRSLVPFYDILPIPENFALWAAERSIRNLTLHLIGKRRAAAAVRAEEAAHGEQQGGAAGRGARDLLALMLAAHDEAGNEQMTDQQLMDECITFLLAGHSTTAHLLTWTFYLLAKHPDWQERLRAELKQALTQQGAGDTSAVPTASTAAGAADKAGSEAGGRWEATREGAAVPFLGRTCQQVCMLGPYDVPRGVNALIPVALLHYDPRYWGPQALHFNPDRFA